MTSARKAPVGRKTPARQNVERREASTELLLGAALRLFVSQGFRATNLEQISSAAGLTKGAVYFYFGSKESVLLEVLKRVREIVVERAQQQVEAAGDDPVDRLVAYIHYQARLGITHRDEVLLLILMSLEYKERPGDVSDFIVALHRRQRRLIEGLVSEGQRLGRVRSDIAPRELAAIVLATHDGTFLEWFRRSSTLRGQELTRALRTVLLAGALAPEGRAAPAARPGRA